MELLFFFYRGFDACFLSNTALLRLWVTPIGRHFQRQPHFLELHPHLIYPIWVSSSEKEILQTWKCEITRYTFTFSSGKNSSKTFSKRVLKNNNFICNFFVVTCTFVFLWSTYTQVFKSSKISEVFPRCFNQQGVLTNKLRWMDTLFTFLDLSSTEANKLHLWSRVHTHIRYIE